MATTKRNIEIKAKSSQEEHIAFENKLKNFVVQVLRQRDTYYNCPNGRLKLREMAFNEADLIFYQRPDATSAKLSEYSIVKLTDNTQVSLTRKMLRSAFGVLNIIRKTRTLYRYGSCRVHLDIIDTQNADEKQFFVEIEALLEPRQVQDDGKFALSHVMEFLGIRPENLVSGSYCDLFPLTKK